MLFENIVLAVSSILANKMRAFLTMLGIIIGIASVIAIVTIGNALTSSVSDSLSQFGTSNVNINVREKSELDREPQRGMTMMAGPMQGPMPSGGGRAVVFRSFGGSTQKRPENSDLISNEMIEEFKETFPNEVIGVSTSYSVGTATAKDKDLYANVSVSGVNRDYMAANQIEITDGRFISDKDISKSRYVAVVSDRFVQNMFKNGEDPIGQDIRVYATNEVYIYTIIGIYKYEESAFQMGDTSSSQDLQTNLYIPISTSLQGVQTKNFSNIVVMCNSETDVLSFTETMKTYFNDVYRNNQTWGINVTSRESQINSIMEVMGNISLAIALIAAISLLVGGIGVMNIMLVSVTERTKEIGTRKAIGAKNFHIRFQFVTEAVIICLVGGIIGVILGTVTGAIISTVLKAPIAISYSMTLISVLFSMTIGVFFGYYPANKAAKLDPVDALRYE